MDTKLATWMLLIKIVLGFLLLFPGGERWDWIPVVSTTEVLRGIGLFSLAFMLLFGPSIIPSIQRLLRFSGWGLALTLAILSLVTNLLGEGGITVWRVLASATSILLVIGLFAPPVLKQFLNLERRQQ